MLKRLVLLFAVAFAMAANAQRVDKYWVSFTDKAAPTEYRLDNPSAYLGPRALERRRRQNITIDSLDLPVCQQYVDALRAAGLMVQNKSKWLNGVAVFVPEWTDVSFLDTMAFVRSAQLVETGLEDVPESSGGVELWSPYRPGSYAEMYSRAYYGHAYDQIAQLKGIDFHKAGYEGQGLIIGVCDGGFPGIDTIALMDTMRAEGRLLATRDFVWRGDNVFSVHPHGTSVLSLMAGYRPGLFVGTAPGASYILCRTENTLVETLMEEYNWAAAAEYLDSMGADIITSSLGYFYFDYSGHNHAFEDLDGNTAPMSIASNIAVSRGMLVLNAAGNDGMSSPQHLNAPADVESVLTVGASTRENQRAMFSSFGPTADGRVKPDVLALGEGVPCANASGVLSASSGTSLATPIMAGMMACLWQRFPEWTPAQLCDSVRAWGHLADNPDEMAGYGIPDFSRAFPGSSVGIDEPLAQLRLFPNPAREYFEVEGVSNARLTIYDVMGRVVKVVDGAGRVATQGLPAGLYLVKITAADGCAMRRIMVER